MMNNELKIRTLVERFFDGETTLGEEHELYNYFSQEPAALPEDLRPLREMFLGASKNLAVHEEEINAHNVFPVPDGDTGTNMCATAQNAAKEIAAIREEDLTWERFASALSGAALFRTAAASRGRAGRSRMER